MARQTRRLPLPMSVLAAVVVATLAGCAAGIVLGEQVSTGAQAGG